jgi:hypothetical protein
MDFTTVPNEWFKAAKTDLELAEYSKNKKIYGNYVAFLQHTEEKLSKGILAIVSILRSKNPNQSIESYFKEVSNGTLKTGTAIDFRHDWGDEFFKNVLNKEFLSYLELPDSYISSITNLKKEFDKFKIANISIEDVDNAILLSRNIFVFVEQYNFNSIKEIIIESASNGLSKDAQKEKLDKIINSATEKSEIAANKTKLPSNIRIIDRMEGSKLMIILEALMPIHSILIPHFKADFPSQEGIIYDENNPIVLRGSEIESVLNELLYLSENIYNELKIAKSDYYIK